MNRKRNLLFLLGISILFLYEFNMTSVLANSAENNLIVSQSYDFEFKFNKTYGGYYRDFTCSHLQTIDGGYLIAGYSWWVEGDTIEYTNGWLIKTNNNGVREWNETYGSTERYDEVKTLIQTTDGGFALVGNTRSQVEPTGEDMWIVKVNSTGDFEWESIFGRSEDEGAFSVVQTTDGGFALVGYTESYGEGCEDIWLVKVNETGDPEWNQTYGEAGYERAYDLVQTSDEGYVIIATNRSLGLYDTDSFILKTDKNGDQLWNRSLDDPFKGSSESSILRKIIMVKNNGFVLAGTTQMNLNSGAAWLVKTNETGHPEWNQTYSAEGGATHYVYDAIKTLDEGFALAGYREGYDISGHYQDGSIIKTDSEGEFTWDLSFPRDESIGNNQFYEFDINSILQTEDESFVFAGARDLYAEIDTNLMSVGSDPWLAKFTAEEVKSSSNGSTSDGKSTNGDNGTPGFLIILGISGLYFLKKRKKKLPK